jgi:hypothetical protein
MDAYLLKILPDKLRLDQLYVQNRSFLTDLDVIAMTMIVFFPHLRGEEIAESQLLSGVFYRFVHFNLAWFILDVFVSIIAVGLSGIIWRISAVINLGIPTYILVAFAIAITNSVINSVIGLPRIIWKTASPTYVIDLGFSVGLTMLLFWIVTRLWLKEPWIPFSLIWLIGCMMFIGLVAVRYRERLFTGLANRWLIIAAAKLPSRSASSLWAPVSLANSRCGCSSAATFPMSLAWWVWSTTTSASMVNGCTNAKF